MILIVDMNYKKASLGFYEFVSPIISIVGNLREHVVKHFSELDADEVSKYDQIVLSGTALKDQATLHQIEKFEWIRELRQGDTGHLRRNANYRSGLRSPFERMRGNRHGTNNHDKREPLVFFHIQSLRTAQLLRAIFPRL